MVIGFLCFCIGARAADVTDDGIVPVEGDTYQTIALAEGWNWVSGYLSSALSLVGKTEGLNRVLSHTEELISDPQLGFVGNVWALKPGVGYKVETIKAVSWAFKGFHFDSAVPISLMAGWNWVGYPHDEAMPLGVVGNAQEGDCIVGQTGFAEYAEGDWHGTLSQLTPGAGYLYKSVTTKQLVYSFDHSVLNMSDILSDSEEFAARYSSYRVNGANRAHGAHVLHHRYPHTMNITARVVMDGSILDASDYCIEAMADTELRGVSRQVGDRLYLTVYGEEPVPLSLLVTQLSTGETFAAQESLTFSSDMVGSYLQPFKIHIGTTTEIVEDERMRDGENEKPLIVYDLQGRKLSTTNYPLSTIKKGCYIIDGRKTVVR